MYYRGDVMITKIEWVLSKAYKIINSLLFFREADGPSGFYLGQHGAMTSHCPDDGIEVLSIHPDMSSSHYINLVSRRKTQCTIVIYGKSLIYQSLSWSILIVLYVS